MKKKCSCCKKIRSNFYKNRSKRDGYDDRCKQCRNKATFAHREKHPDEEKKRQKKSRHDYYQRHRERLLEQSKAYYVDHKKEVSERVRRYKETHPEVQARANLKQRLRGYGLSPDEYVKLGDKQKWLCAVCKEDPRDGLVVDHDHRSGRVRGLLCKNCNLGLGLFRDDRKKLQRAARYLRVVSELE